MSDLVTVMHNLEVHKTDTSSNVAWRKYLLAL